MRRRHRPYRDPITGAETYIGDVTDNDTAAAEARDRAREATARRAAQARGDYVPSPAAGLRAAVLTLNLHTNGVPGRVVPVREDASTPTGDTITRMRIYRIDTTSPDAATTALRDAGEVQAANGALWLRTITPEPAPRHPEPF